MAEQGWMFLQCNLFRGAEVWHLYSQFTCGEEAEARTGAGAGNQITVGPEMETGGHLGNEP